jgi:drug/metabolite transporter (DMT)-like permease
MTTKQAWIGFWLLALIWGSSFLFIRIGVEQVPPLQLVFLRTGIAAAGLYLVVALRGKRLPTDWRSLGDLLFLGTVNTVIPFALITWGETRIDSGLASVLQATAALFTLVVAHFAFADERITRRKLAGLLVGFLGVVVLAGRGTALGGAADVLGQLAIVAASFCYALGGTYSRRAIQNRLDPLVVAAGAMTVAAVITGLATFLAPVVGGPSPVDISALRGEVLGALLALGVVNTFGAYLIFYPLVAVLGAARTSMVTYVIPVVGLLLGALLLDEQVDLRLLLGALMILGGIGIVSLRVKLPFRARGLARRAKPETPNRPAL